MIQYPPHLTFAFALPGESGPSTIRVKVNEKRQ